MRRPKRTGGLVVALALLVCALGATASSALAVTIEPLSTKFTGTLHSTSAVWELGETGPSVCKGATLTGTTNATKTNYINATPGFTECSVTEGTVKIKLEFSSSCAKEGTIPWTITLGESRAKSLKLNCALVIKIPADNCTMTAPEQTAGGAGGWETVKSVNLNLIFATFLSGLKDSKCLIVGNPTFLELSSEILINGIHAE